MSTTSRDQRRAEARAQREAAERAAAASEQRRRRLLQLGGVLLAALAVVAIVVATTGGGETATTSTPQGGEPVAGRSAIAEQLDGIPQHGITLGRRTAPITVVEFVDLQCPICAAFSNTEMPKLVEDYVRPGTVRFELRTLAFLGDDSGRLARMAQAAAEQDRLFQFTELVYANQGAENSGYATDDFLRRIGGAVGGLDVAEAMKARDGAAVDQRLADAGRLASIQGISGTPSFLVGPTGGDLELVDGPQLRHAIERLAARHT
ncbi:MAG TPA: DsbA family protein [Capillimicrobium sp.]|nr:DsbA family protein [Capillimicrobium sp.]